MAIDYLALFPTSSLTTYNNYWRKAIAIAGRASTAFGYGPNASLTDKEIAQRNSPPVARIEKIKYALRARPVNVKLGAFEIGQRPTA